MACDTSPYGLGAVLSHQERLDELPITFASCSLAPAKKDYLSRAGQYWNLLSQYIMAKSITVLLYITIFYSA